MYATYLGKPKGGKWSGSSSQIGYYSGLPEWSTEKGWASQALVFVYTAPVVSVPLRACDASKVTQQPLHPELAAAWEPCLNHPHRMTSTTAQLCPAIPASFQHTCRLTEKDWYSFRQGMCLVVIGLFWKWLNKSPWSKLRLKYVKYNFPWLQRQLYHYKGQNLGLGFLISLQN